MENDIFQFLQIKPTGMLFCYKTRKEMMTIYDRLIALDLKGAAIQKAYNKKAVQNKWTIGVICMDKIILAEADKILVDVDVGDADQYDGEARIREFFGMMIFGEYEPGYVKVVEGYCPLKAINPIACSLCHFGHILECHYPMTCEQTRNAKVKCSHLERDEVDEDAMYRDE